MADGETGAGRMAGRQDGCRERSRGVREPGSPGEAHLRPAAVR